MTDTSPIQIRVHGPTCPSYEPDASTDKCFKARRSGTSHRPLSTDTAREYRVGACNRRQPPSDRPRRAPRALPHRAGRRTGRARLRSARHDRRSAARRASQDGLLQARGEARVRIGARLANRGGQSARRGRRVIGGWVRRSGITCSRGGSAIRAARSTVEGVLYNARSGGLGQKVVGWVRSGRARFE